VEEARIVSPPVCIVVSAVLPVGALLAVHFRKHRAVQVVLYWYQEQGQAIAGEGPARIAMVRSAIGRHRPDGALVRVSMPVSGSVEETTTRPVQYVQTLYPVLGQYLPASAADEGMGRHR
jgi:EpsI family protein